MWWIVLAVILAICYILHRFLRSLKVGNLSEKHVLITGCDSGFGREFAKRLDSMGIPVFAGCLMKDTAETLSQECSSRLTTLILDVTKSESIGAALEQVKQKLPNDKALWAVVNNAGIPGLWGPPEWCTRAHYMTAFNVNFFGMAEMTRVFLPLIRKSKGRIVNTASVAGRVAFMALPYTCSKFAVEAFTDCTRRHLSQMGVKMFTVEPGCFKTPIFIKEGFLKNLQAAYAQASPDVKEAYDKSVIDKYYGIASLLADTGNEDTGLVVDAYTHAVTAQYPKTRYIVGWDARLIYTPLSLCPDWLTDIVLDKIIGAIPKINTGN